MSIYMGFNIYEDGVEVNEFNCHYVCMLVAGWLFGRVDGGEFRFIKFCF